MNAVENLEKLGPDFAGVIPPRRMRSGCLMVPTQVVHTLPVYQEGSKTGGSQVVWHSRRDTSRDILCPKNVHPCK